MQVRGWIPAHLDMANVCLVFLEISAIYLYNHSYSENFISITVGLSCE
jgi:hypothetical protein